MPTTNWSTHLMRLTLLYSPTQVCTKANSRTCLLWMAMSCLRRPSLDPASQSNPLPHPTTKKRQDWTTKSTVKSCAAKGVSMKTSLRASYGGISFTTRRRENSLEKLNRGRPEASSTSFLSLFTNWLLWVWVRRNLSWSQSLPKLGYIWTNRTLLWISNL
jgi:hypothetical protein